MSRPTVLIGHGAFGRDALQRLLRGAALRGVLPWTHGQSGGERQLRDLALLWVRERDAAAVDGESAADPSEAGSTPEFLSDLYRQIREVTAPGDALPLRQALALATVQAKRRLLAPQARRERDGDGGAAGLDLIVLARPDSAPVLGRIDDLLRTVLEALLADPTLRRTGSGAQVLNAIAIFDFEDYWSADAQQVRQTLIDSASGWEARRREDRPALDRLYLLDRHTPGADRDPDSRLDEAALFLEFLLFEGQRADLQLLFQQTGSQQPVSAAFGIRLLERSPALLARIAAARFGQGWLPYLAGDVPLGRSPRRVREALARLHAAPGDDPLGDGWKRGIETLESDLLALPNRESADWPERARAALERHRRALSLELATLGSGLVADLTERHLQPQGAAIRAAIDADLHDEREPVALAEVQRALEQALAALPAAVAADPEPMSPSADLESLHARLRERAGAWIGRQGRALWPFWAWLGGLLGLALAPFAARLLAALPEPDPLAGLPFRLYEGLQWATHPAPLALVLGLLAWLSLWLAAGPAVRRRIARGRAVDLDAQAGRLAASVRALEEPLHRLLERARAETDAALTAAVGQALGQLRDRLAERRLEMHWLQGQLGELLRMHGEPAELSEGPRPARRARIAVRQWVEGPGDLASMLGANPAEPNRWREHQPALPRPFEGWSEPHCDAFLDPLAFVEQLSLAYRDARVADPASLGDAEEQALRRAALADFLAHRDFSLAFAFARESEATGERRYAVLPAAWQGLPDTRERLMDVGIAPEDTLTGRDPDRVYLLRVATGMPVGCLGP